MTEELRNRQGDLAFELLDLASVLTLDSGEVNNRDVKLRSASVGPYHLKHPAFWLLFLMMAPWPRNWWNDETF